MKDSLSKIIGQLFIVGFDGYSVPEEYKRLALKYHLGGTIYFKKNVQSPAQLAELTNEIQDTCRDATMPGLFVSIDHEGGKVNRLVKPFTKFPGNDHLGILDSPKIGFDFGTIIATELKAIGVNVNFAPVVDVLVSEKSQIARHRSFSSAPEVCARLGSAVSRGLQKNGILAVAKHFPGHGSVVEDSHHTLPEYHVEKATLEERDFIPFRKVIRSGIEGVMTAHIKNTALDTESPATLSSTCLTILRDEMRFQKIIFSDDMEMNAITDHYSVGEAAVKAIQAGCDCLIYRGTEFPEEAIKAVIKAVKDDEIPLEKIQNSLDRIIEAKKKYVSLTPLSVTTVTETVGRKEHFQLAEYILSQGSP